MDNKRINSIQREYDSRIDIIQPVAAIGKLLFFDYYKNKFGIISEIRCAKVVKADKVHVSESALSTEKQLYNGETVTLYLNKGYKGFFATDVKSISEINLKTVSQFAELIDIHELENAIYNTVKDEYKYLDLEDKALVIKILQRENNADAW